MSERETNKERDGIGEGEKERDSYNPASYAK